MSKLSVFLVVVCLSVAPYPIGAQTKSPIQDDSLSSETSDLPAIEFPATTSPSEPLIADPHNQNHFVADSSTPETWSGPPPLTASVEGPASTAGTWWVIAPYAWVPGIHGQITTFGQTRDVNINTSDVLGQLHNANGALQLHLEAGRDRFGLILDTNIVRFSTNEPAPLGGTFNFDLQQTLVELLGVYRLIEIPSAWSNKQTTSIDLLGGARYYNFTNGITITPASPLLPVIPLGQSGTWVDMVVGVRGRAPLMPGLDAFVRGDFGGFGIGTSSSLAWNLITGLSLEATDHCSLVAGYRVFDINESQQSGTAQFAINAKMQGPFLALAFQY